ncbi:MAG: histidine phosphatase family protein [Candidatus Saccharibacteria bacterium]|nr:histidine phosphatase family protein [Candidatus Saccharibacteria bacterium]
MKIILVRHGETDWNLESRLMGQTDIPLNKHGIEQAHTLKDSLAGVEFDCCFSSPLLRAKETADIIREDRNCDVVCDDLLMERFGGKFEGQVLDSWAEVTKDETAETSDQLLDRARNFFEKLKKTKCNAVLVVTHNGILKNLRHVIKGNTGPLDYHSDSFKNCEFEVYEI